jgi:hypothetical protein
LLADLSAFELAGSEECADVLLRDAESFGRVFDGEKIWDVHFGII